MSLRKAFKVGVVSLLAAFLSLGGSAGAGMAGQESELLRLEFEQERQAVAGFNVESLEAFQKIAAYHDSVMNDPAVVHRFEAKDGNVILCVDIYTQESVRAAGIDPGEITLSPATPPKEGESSHAGSAGLEKAALPGGEWLDGSTDPLGRHRTCPHNAFPKLAPRLKDLYRYRSLEDYYRKYPSGGKSKGVATEDAENLSPRSLSGGDSAVHKHAIGSANIKNIGGGADFSLWSPFVGPNDFFSLTQLWMIDSSYTQTVEFGWQKYPSFYGDQRPHLFIYWTADNYNNTGCYNLTCPGFVQTDTSIVIAGPFNTVSKVGGNQVDIPLEAWWESGTGKWWLRYGGTKWLGYYPSSLYSPYPPGSLATGAAYVELGGEACIQDKESRITWMGSGQYPSAGMGKAAFIRRVHYWDTSSNLQNAGFSTFVDYPSDNPYVVSNMFLSTPIWGAYFYYGGP
jgi:hypothetical protein